MANSWYNTGLTEVLDTPIDLETDTIKIIAIDNTTYTFNADDDVVDAAGANDVVDAEITATNYVPGWGNAGRRTLAGKSWTALGGAVNDTVGAYVGVKEGGADDTTSRLIFYIDTLSSGTLPFTTNGSDVTVTPNTEGLLQNPTS